jgi:hypothetical protein
VTTTGEQNGSGRLAAFGDRALEPPPERVRELAMACVGFVARATGVTLDFEPETLSVLDHYVEQARSGAQVTGPVPQNTEKPQERREILALVARVAGAYFGEVVRRRHKSWWRAASDDPAEWRIEFEDLYLSLSPVQLVADALLRTDDDSSLEEGAQMYAGLELLEEDQEAARDRLADLPEVPIAEYYAPTTRLEVIDIVAEAIRARRIAAGEDAVAALAPGDYDD